MYRSCASAGVRDCRSRLCATPNHSSSVTPVIRTLAPYISIPSQSCIHTSTLQHASIAYDTTHGISSADSSASSNVGSSSIQRLSRLFANLPIPKSIQTMQAAMQAASGRETTTNTKVSAPSTPFTATQSTPPNDPRHAAAAAVAVTHLTPQFIVFIRADADIDRGGGPVTAQTILAHAASQGLDWQQTGGLGPRHIHVLTAPDGMSYSRMAGFPCRTAFYITFPKHETRSPARVKYVEQMLDATPAAKQLQGWGWKLIRYPNQLQLSTGPGRMAFAGGKELSPRAVILTARNAGLPGWDVLEESMFIPWKHSAWIRYSGGKAQVQFSIRVPPHPRYLAAIADVARTAADLRTKLGWVVEIPRNQSGMQQEVPALPIPAARPTPKPVTPTAAAQPSTSAPTPATAPSSSASTSAPRAPSPPPTRFYFYFIDEHGKLFIEDETSAARPHGKQHIGLGLRDRRALNVIYSQLRVAQEALQHGPLAEHVALPVVIPPGTKLLDGTVATQSTPPTPLPLGSIARSYPFLSMCAGELNFLRCSVVPIVFKSIIPSTPAAPAAAASSTSTTSFLLQYGGDLSHPFDPRTLSVDPTGRLFHPTPPLGSTPGSDIGLIASNLAQELTLHESSFTREEVDYSIRQQEATRRLTIEFNEEYHRRLEASPSQFSGGITPDQWIRANVETKLKVLGLHIQFSKYVVEWQGQIYRIRTIEQVVKWASE